MNRRPKLTLWNLLRNLRKRPGTQLTGKYDADFLAGITWYAVDLEGKVAAFESGEIPPSAMAVVEKWAWVDDQLRNLPPAGEPQLHIRKEQYWEGVRPVTRLSPQTMANIADRFWPHVERSASELPARGVYLFWGEKRQDGCTPWTYKLVAAPTSPININALDDRACGVIASMTFPVRFSEVMQINVREVQSM